MTEAWAVVGLLGAATVAIKSAGPVLFGGRELPDRLRGVAELLAPALLAALVVTQILGAGRSLALDARSVGLAAAALLLWRKVPVLPVVVVAAVVTGVVRALS